MMSDILILQGKMFMVSLHAGVCMVLMYELIRCFRRIIRHNCFFSALEDFAFWIGWTIYVVNSITVYNYGTPRLYIFCGIALGMLLVSCLLDVLLMPILFRGCRLINEYSEKGILVLKNLFKRCKIKLIIRSRRECRLADNRAAIDMYRSSYGKKEKKKIN